MHDARSLAMPTRPPHAPRTYEDIARATVPDPDSSWRPSVAEERRAFQGFRAMEPAEQALWDEVHDALLEAGVDTTPLHIEVDRNRVILRGQVHDQEALMRIPSIVGDVAGVTAVIDQLVIAAP